MEEITLIMAAIAILFFLFISMQRHLRKFCALCAAVFVTWVVLLVLYYLDLFTNAVLIALLMGLSATGIFYLAEKKVPAKLRLFRLPFLLTLIWIGFGLITDFAASAIFLLSGLWILFAGLFLYRSNKTVRGIAKKIIACCRRW